MKNSIFILALVFLGLAAIDANAASSTTTAGDENTTELTIVDGTTVDSETTTESDTSIDGVFPNLNESGVPEMEAPMPWIYCFGASCCSIVFFELDIGSVTVCISGGSIAAPPSLENPLAFTGPIEITPDEPVSQEVEAVTLEEASKTEFRHRFGTSTLVIPAGKYPVKEGTIYIPKAQIF